MPIRIKLIRFFLLCVILSAFKGQTIAQNTETKGLNFDSLVQANERYQKQDEIKLKMLNKLAKGYSNINSNKGVETGQQAIALAIKLNSQLLLAEAYYNKGLNHAALAEYSIAQELYEKSLAINQNLKNTFGIAHNTLSIGEVFRKKGESKKAKENFEQALTLFESIQDKAGIAKCYNGFGNILLYPPNYSKALEYYQKALAINEQLGYKTEIARNLNNIGLANQYLSDYPKALEYYQKALEINKQLGVKPSMASNLLQIGKYYTKLFNYTKALEYFKEALVINESLGNKTTIGVNLTDIANTYHYLSDYSKALAYYQKALIIFEQTGNEYDKAACLSNIGLVYDNLSDYPKALDYQQKALTIFNQIGNKNSIADVLGGIASIYDDLSDYLKALEYYQKALDIAQQIDDKKSIAYNTGNLGSTYKKLLDNPKALLYYQKSLAILEQLGDKRGMATILGNIGNVYKQLSDYPKALEYGQKALKINEDLGNKNGISINLVNMGNVYRDAPDSDYVKMGISPSKRYEKALECQNKSLTMAKETGALRVQKDAWAALSITYDKLGDYAKAYSTYKNSITLQDSIESNAVKNKVERKAMQYEFEKKETEFKFQQQLSSEQLLRSAQEAKLSKQQLQLSNKEKDLQRLAYLKEKAEKQQKENLLVLSKKERQLNLATIDGLGKEKDLQQTALQLSQAEVHRKNQERNAFVVGMVLFLVLSFFIFRNYVIQRQSNKTIKAVNQELRETQGQLVQQEKLASLGALTAGIAHEIKNPLNFVNNFAELSNELIDEYDAATNEEEKNELLQLVKQNLSKINEHGKRADSIVKNMLEHSRNGNGEKLLTDINKLGEEFLNLAYQGMRANIKDFNCTIEKHFDAQLPKINVVPQDISRVILNVLNNAFYAIKDKADAKIILGTKLLSKTIQISIKDNGTGMSESVKKKIFEPFYTTKPSGSGTGLGLSLSFDIIKAHGGKMDVLSEEGKGTEFIITLTIEK